MPRTDGNSSVVAADRGLATLAAVAGVATGVYAAHLRFGHPERLSDLTQVIVGARAWLDGQNPYDAVRSWADFPFPLLYPFTAILVFAPLARLPFWLVDGLFVGAGVGILAWALVRNHGLTPRALALVSAPLLHAVTLSQWSPALTAAALVPSLGFVFACKPNIGLAILAAYPRPRAVLGAAGLTAISVVIWPAWFESWRVAVRNAPNAIWLAGLPGGLLLLLAAVRWRRPEARLLLMLGCIPHTTLPYEALPLFLIPGSWTEGWILWGGTAVALLGHGWGEPYASQLAWVRAGGLWTLYCAYLPCLVMVLRRPNLWRDVPAPAEGSPTT